MMKDSLKTLLNQYPYFFNKSSTSNFFKSQSVTNERFRDVYQSIFEIVESFHLNKRCLIWKDQVVAYDYTMNFIVNCPNLKYVKVYKNDELLYMESYNYDDHVSSFIYSHEDTTLDVHGNGEIIPTATYKLSAETYDEIILEKGFPENDGTILNDIYDHDASLDEFGAFLDVPRKEYILVSDELLSATEPPYNNRLSEDDYHYMNRMLNYALLYHTTPLPILELWKLWGITATMENREKYLLKMFDERLYDYDEETGLVGDWIPKPWEHKDTFCQNDIDLGEYFFVRPSTNVPVRKSDVILNWVFMNNLAEILSNDYLVDIYQEDGALIFENLTGSSQKLKHNLFTDNVNKFKVVGKTENGKIIGMETVTIMVRGCATANWYVSPNGDDNNNGKSVNTPFQTIQKAVSQVRGDRNIISLLNGDYTIIAPIKLHNSCNIIGCTSASIENTVNNKFFEIPAGKTLILNDLSLIRSNSSYSIEDMQVLNNNEVASIFVSLPENKTPVYMELSTDTNIIMAGETVNIAVKISDENTNPIYGLDVRIGVYRVSDDSLVEMLTVTEEGDAYISSYTGTGAGDVYIKADCMNLTETYVIWDANLTSSNMSISNDGNKITLKNNVTGYADTQINNLDNVPPTNMVVEFDSYAPNQTRNSESIGLCVYGDSNTRTFILHNQNEYGNKELAWANYGSTGYQRYNIELKERWLHNKFIFQNNSMTYELYYEDTLLASKTFNLNSALLNSNNFHYTFICPWANNGERYVKNFKITKL